MSKVDSVLHFRYTKSGVLVLSNYARWSSDALSPLGGVTTVTILDDNGNPHIGATVCSFSDQYCRRVGYKIAKQRAEYALQHDMEFFPPKTGNVFVDEWAFIWDWIMEELDGNEEHFTQLASKEN